MRYNDANSSMMGNHLVKERCHSIMAVESINESDHIYESNDHMRLTFGSPGKPTVNPRGLNLAAEVPFFSIHDSVNDEAEKAWQAPDEMLSTRKTFRGWQNTNFEVEDHLAHQMEQDPSKKNFIDTLR